MREIIVNTLCSNAFSERNALILREQIQEAIDAEETVILDFTGISKFTTLFFNFSTGYFVSLLGPTKYSELITVKGLTELGESTYNSSYSNAKEKYSEDESNSISAIVGNPE